MASFIIVTAVAAA